MIDTLSALTLPWVFSQSPPLSTSGFMAEMKKRGVDLDSQMLRELYRHGDLQPLAEITSRSAGPRRPVSDFPAVAGSLHASLRVALAAGRVRDPRAEECRRRLRFDERRPTDPRGWMNGLVYGRWQLLMAPYLRQRLMSRRFVGPAGRRRLILPRRDEWEDASAVRLADWVLALTALEARYLPIIDPEWVHLSNVEIEDWEEFRDLYDPVAMAEVFQVAADEVRTLAKWLLLRAGHLDPTGDWSKLIRRAPRRAWSTLRGDALVALDYRLAAEILLLFYEDLVERGAAEPLPEAARVWHPLSERISYHGDDLDSVLSRLGVSPHPGVVLVVEGETEELLIPRVFDHLGLRRTPDLVRVLCMRGVSKDLSLVAAATVAPLLGQRHGDSYDMIRPPTRLVIAVDQDQGWETPEQVNRKRAKILDAIRAVIAAQGVSVSDDDLESFVEVRQWPAKCFEFAHFDDVELADALMGIPSTRGGLARSELIERIADTRKRGLDIKKVWDHSWSPQPTKPGLADALWPTLAAKIDDARWSETTPIPSVAEVVHETYLMAQLPRSGTFVIRTADQ